MTDNHTTSNIDHQSLKRNRLGSDENEISWKAKHLKTNENEKK